MRVRNQAGEKEFIYNVIVYSLPSLKTTINDQMTVKAMEGTQFTSDCDIDAIPEPEVCYLLVPICFNFESGLIFHAHSD